jgi:hypothetical protein
MEIVETAQARPYKFDDFFAGFGGLSTAMEYAAQGKEEVHMTVGGFAGQRNTLHVQELRPPSLEAATEMASSAPSWSCSHSHFPAVAPLPLFFLVSQLRTEAIRMLA